MKTLPLADARILAPIVAFLESNGSKAGAYLDRQRIPGEMVEAGGMIAKKQIHDLFAEVARREGCEQVGFAAYHGFQLADIGVIGEAMRMARTVRESLDVFTTLASGAYEGNEYYVEADGETTWLCFRDDDHDSPGYQYSHHVTLMCYRQIVCLLADESWRPERMRCHGPNLPKHASVEGFEDCVATFNQYDSALAVPTELLSRPIHIDCEIENTSSPVDLPINENSKSNTFVCSLHRLIQSRFLYQRFPTLEQVAIIIDINPRTIQRYLREHGLTYRKLLDRIAFDAACEMLQTSQMTVGEVAQELGYSGSNNFVRGFRRMTGMTPAQYRQRHCNY